MGMDAGDYDPVHLPIGLDHRYNVQPRYLIYGTERNALTQLTCIRIFASVLECRKCTRMQII